ncbi:MAG: ADP-ribosylation factor-like protein, partial [Promethearchaeota archaeon]
MKLDFAKYEFELSSLKPVKENLINSEKILNRIYSIINNAEENIRKLSLGEIFKKDLFSLKKEVQNNFGPFINYTFELSKDIEEVSGEIQDFSLHLKQNIDKFQNFLDKIMAKTPEIVGPFDKFKELDQNYFANIYNYLDKLRSIFEDVPSDIMKKSDQIYLVLIAPLYYINENRREKKTEYKTIKRELELLLDPHTLTEDKNIENNEQLETVYEKIRTKKTEYQDIIDRITELMVLNKNEEIKVILDTIESFSLILEDLKGYTSEAYKTVKEINVFFEELNFGVIFQEDLDLLNDIFYDYFDPLLKSFQEIANNVTEQNIEKIDDFIRQFQQKIIKTQETLNEVIEHSMEPFKQIDFDIESINTYFSEFRAALKKITIKSGHISKEVKNILKYLQNMALIVSDKYLTELKDMSSDLGTIIKDLEEKSPRLKELIKKLEIVEEVVTEPEVIDEEEPIIKKIALLGLGAAGKTSFFEVLQKNFGTLHQLKPTKGISRKMLNILGCEFSIWDYGGQDIYRADYISKSDKFFSEIDLIFYFVDVQEDTIDESVEYFQQLIDLPQFKSIDPSRILVQIHKLDPEQLDQEEMQSKINEIKEAFEAIENVTFFETSIYDYWSILVCFSEGLKR